MKTQLSGDAPLELKLPLRSEVAHEFYLVTQQRQPHMYERGLVWGEGNQTSSTVERSGGRDLLAIHKLPAWNTKGMTAEQRYP